MRLISTDPQRLETKEIDYDYDMLPSGEPYLWDPAVRGNSDWDAIDYHVDLGCGTLKKGRFGIDHNAAPGVDLVFDFDRLAFPAKQVPGQPKDQPYVIGRLPFYESSIQSVISHHALEHVGDGFLRLMDEIYRVLEPGGLLRAITPLFPSHTAVADPDHRRYFCEGTWESFCGTPDNCWQEGFSVPYTSARFTMEDKDITPRSRDAYDWWTEKDAREIRVALRANK